MAYNYYSGYGYQQQPAQQQQQGLIWVNSIDEANSYIVAPNSAVQLWDRNSPTIYLKTADATGMPCMRIFDLKERKENGQNNVSRDEFDALVNKVNALLKDGDGNG